MAWLWLISVGVTDVQFPVWRRDEYGQWNGPSRFEVGRGGVRSIHEGLLALLESGQIIFPDEHPKAVPRFIARDLRLEFLQEDGAFLATVDHVDYRISELSDAIPNEWEQRLPLYCPKLKPLLAPARALFADRPVTVVVLNTRRNADLPDGPNEPVAAGPLIAQFLAQQLGLEWINSRGALPETLAPGTSTWIDILTGDEAMELPATQGRVVRRLTSAVRSWNGGLTGDIAVTISGGMPPLKPLIERVPATCIGQRHVKLLYEPEHGRGEAASFALDYDARVPEQQTLRFHCAEALRNNDYSGAYGLTNRFPEQPWSTQVHSCLGPLLELPGGPLQINGRPLPFFALCASQIELSLCMGDIAGALKRLGQFIETSIWALIANDDRIDALSLQVDRADECLAGPLAISDQLVEKNLIDYNSKGPDRHGLLGLTWRWPAWLSQDAGRQTEAATALETLCRSYSTKPRKYRNLLIHGSDEPLALGDIKSCMKAAHLIVNMNRPFGENFLAVNEVQRLLTGLGTPSLGVTVGKKLEDLLTIVIAG